MFSVFFIDLCVEKYAVSKGVNNGLALLLKGRTILCKDSIYSEHRNMKTNRGGGGGARPLIFNLGIR
jgi:hypothetical protein